MFLKFSPATFVNVAMHKKWQIPRRTFLRGLGTAMALPMLEAMSPVTKLFAANREPNSFPKRMAFVYVPNGANMADWTPKKIGADFDFPYILEPLKPFQKDILVLSGLAHDKARSHGDGGGDHARASAAFLTGCQPRKTQGVDIKAGISVDQIAAQKIGKETRFSSLELGCEGNRQAGNCDSGYSCAYQANISWKGDSTPMPPEIDPRFVFERLFANNSSGEISENLAKRKRYQQSILDFVLEDAKQLQKNLGYTDRRKLDEYLTAVRELEERLEKAEKFATALPGTTRPTGIPGGPDGFEKHIRLMYDLQALAFQTDTTRISTLMVAFDGSNRPYKSIGISEGHHDLSHHAGDEAKMQKIAKINHFHSTQFAYFLEKLKSIPEGEGTLLDNCMIVYGSGIGDGNAHNHDNLPVLFAGRGGGSIQLGRHVRFEKETPMTNLYLSMLDRMEIPVERIGDSTGKLKELS
ncbi:MAG: DUF1552 domain-containing protein [Verrucomicrobiota bacterium]